MLYDWVLVEESALFPVFKRNLLKDPCIHAMWALWDYSHINFH